MNKQRQIEIHKNEIRLETDANEKECFRQTKFLNEWIYSSSDQKKSDPSNILKNWDKHIE